MICPRRRSQRGSGWKDAGGMTTGRDARGNKEGGGGGGGNGGGDFGLEKEETRELERAYTRVSTIY